MGRCNRSVCVSTQLLLIDHYLSSQRALHPAKRAYSLTGYKRVIINLSVAVKQQIVSETLPGWATTTTLKPGANLIVNTFVLNVVARA